MSYCEYAGHEWRDAGGDLLMCAECGAEKCGVPPVSPPVDHATAEARVRELAVERLGQGRSSVMPTSPPGGDTTGSEET